MAWQIAAAFALGSGLSSRSAKRKAARAARREAYRQATRIRAQKTEVALAATQQHLDRMEQFEELSNYNEAMNAFMGRTGRSVSALRKKEESVYGRDVTRMRYQEAREKDRLEEEAKAVIARGRVTADTYNTQARLSLFETAYKTASSI